MRKNLSTLQVGNMACIVDLIDSVELLFEEKPDKRKKTEYQDWMSKINALILEINKQCKFKMYETIK